MLRFGRLATHALVATVATLLAGCGGAGGSGAIGSPHPPPTTPGNGTTASVTLVIPPATAQSVGRKTDYVSPNTASIQILITNVNGSPTVPPGIPAKTTVALTTGTGGNCTAPAPPVGETCTVPIPAPAGNIVYQFTILDAHGNALATATKEFKILLGQANTNLQVVLSGIVAAVKILVPSIASGVPLQANLSITALDASGATIDASAPFATPVTLTDTDPSTSTSLSTPALVNQKTVTLPGSSTPVTFKYSGGPIAPFSINATVGGVAVGTSGTIVPSTQAISFSNTFLDTNTNPKGPSYGQPTIFFGTVGPPGAVTQTTTATESGYNGVFTATIAAATCTDPTNGQPVASLTGSPGTTFTVSSLNPGFCQVVVSDTINHRSIFWVSVSTGVVNINAHAHRVIK